MTDLSLLVSLVPDSFSKSTDAQKGLRVVVSSTDEEARASHESFVKMVGDRAASSAIVLLPGFVQCGVFRFESARKVIAQRLSCWRQLQSGLVDTLFTSLRGLSRFAPHQEWLEAHTLKLEVGVACESEKLIAHLELCGYLSVAGVSEVGDFSVRGGIVDVWIPGQSHPVRIELFGDEVEEMRHFRTSDQRSFEVVPKLEILPCREFHWPQGEALEECLERLNALTLAQRLSGQVRADLFENVRHAVPFLGIDDVCAALFSTDFRGGWEELQRIAKRHSRELELHWDGLPKSHFQVLSDDLKMYEKAVDTALHKGYLQAPHAQVFLGLAAALERNGDWKKALLNQDWDFLASLQLRPWHFFGLEQSSSERFQSQELPSRRFAPSSQVEQRLSSEECLKASGRARVLSDLLANRTAESDVRQLHVGLRSASSVDDVVGFLRQGFPNLEMPENLSSGLPEALFASNPVPRVDDSASAPLFFVGDVPTFLYSKQSQVLVVSETWLRGGAAGVGSGLAAEAATTETASGSSRSNAEILLQAQFAEFREGDLVVHMQHGVGRFKGLATVKIGDASGDFLAIEYAEKDKIYVPIDKMALVQRYVGSASDDDSKLDSLKSQMWEKKREKARKDAEKIARELLGHQAKRETSPGHAFGEHTDEILAFEGAFPYDETADQLKAGREIAADMMAVGSMDRLLCGDVGFGKTEVAMRAAYRAVLDGKQVAWLVPTTVLAHQHERSLSERFADFGVRVALLDRGSGTKNLKATLEALKEGRVDILIGTHRILSADVQFRALGLLVVDEEQRFGVLQKEKIKNMSYGVDVLTMTATPIPRTLQLAMLGLRDLSLLTTPPKARLAVKTFVSPFDQDVVKDALEAELNRGGQSFFVHNRVEDLESVRNFLLELLPSLRIGVGHGQLPQKELDKVIISFLDGKFDVLLCTTIIESGIDMPNVNTIIVQDADHFGLAQLYQLRGRVGRRSSRGYAHFLLSPGSSEKDDGFKRLEILKEHQGLGSGFVVASHDLEMRGSGNIMGDDQSGKVNDVGLETYTQMLDEAIKTLGGVKVEQHRDVDLKIPVDVKIPEAYIQSARERLRCYRKFFAAGTEEALQNLLEECEDRFGPLPETVRFLGETARLKRLAMRMRAVSLVVSEKLTEIRLDPVVLQGSDEHADLVRRILDVCNRQSRAVRLTPDGRILHAGLRSADFKGVGIEKSFSELRVLLATFSGDLALV